MRNRYIDILIGNWLEGDDIVFKKIFEYYYPRLIPVCLKSIKQFEDAEEIVLNVLMDIWLQRQKVAEVNDFEGYIFTVLRNQVASFMRRNVLETENIDNIPISQLGMSEQPEITFKELQQLYLDSINQLPQKRKEIFLMSREQGLSHQEIAERQHISVHTVSNHITSAMKVLRNDLGAYADTLSLIIILTSTTHIC